MFFKTIVNNILGFGNIIEVSLTKYALSVITSNKKKELCLAWDLVKIYVVCSFAKLVVPLQPDLKCMMP